MLKTTLKTLTAVALVAGSAMMATAQDIKIRATANSNTNDEDYDGLVVFKNYVEAASNGAIGVELFIGTQLCSNGAECLQGVADGSDRHLHLHLGRCVGHLPVCAGARSALPDG